MTQATRHGHLTFAGYLERAWREAALWTFVAAALYLVIALATYAPQDPGWSQVGEELAVSNLGGRFGAWFADLTLFLFGLFAYLIPLTLAWSGWLVFRARVPEPETRLYWLALRWVGFLVLLAAGSALLSIHLHSLMPSLPNGVGGGLGQMVANQAAASFGATGASVFLSGLLFIGFTLFTGLSPGRMMEAVGALVLGFLRLPLKLVRALGSLRLPGRRKQTADEVSDEAWDTFGDLPPRHPEPLPAFAGAGAAGVLPAEDALDSGPTAGRLAHVPTAPPLVGASPAEIAGPADELPQPLPDAPSTVAMPTRAPMPAEPARRHATSPAVSPADQDLLLADPWDGLDARQGAVATPRAGADVVGAAAAALHKVAALLHRGPREEAAPPAAGSSAPVAARAPVPASPKAPATPVGCMPPGEYQPPPLELLDPPRRSGRAATPAQLAGMGSDLITRLGEFGVSAQVVEVHPGPVVTLFEIELAPGIKVSKITGLAKDLARALSKISVRVVEVIPGKSCIGIEVPNDHREMVVLREILAAPVYQDNRSPLTIGMGTNISGEPVVADLGRMPHALIAGTTGSGKSVAINAMVLSLVYKASPEDVRLIMVDPKMLELSVYEGIPHLLTPVVTDMKEAANALRWCVGEMERRYRLMSRLGVRNIAGYNRKVEDATAAGTPLPDPLFTPLEGVAETPPMLAKLPYIVVIIDELADMMMVVGKKVEELIARLAQKARASGIHLLLATQRPSVDVLTGLIKANIPTRIAFRVSARVDSRTVLDQMGAEHLLGHGDMLYLPGGGSIPQRVHGAFVDDHEVHKVVDHLKLQGPPQYIDTILQEPGEHLPGIDPEPRGGGDVEDQDPLFDEAVAYVCESRRASISGVQRKLKIGYNRAARMIEEMERIGVVGPAETNGNRAVLAPPPLDD